VKTAKKHTNQPSILVALTIGGGRMIPFTILILITGFSLIMALRKKKTFFLVVPFLSIFVYFFIEILLVPAPFFDTVKFIFGLR
jgi:hypothetical protein